MYLFLEGRVILFLWKELLYVVTGARNLLIGKRQFSNFSRNIVPDLPPDCATALFRLFSINSVTAFHFVPVRYLIQLGCYSSDFATPRLLLAIAGTCLSGHADIAQTQAINIPGETEEAASAIHVALRHKVPLVTITQLGF
jgi:hypothetical protein